MSARLRLAARVARAYARANLIFLSGAVLGGLAVGLAVVVTVAGSQAAARIAALAGVNG